MVASPHAAASESGADVLRAGGSAVDAALATASTLGVLYPHMCGIGGDAFWLVYDAAARKVSYLDGGGRAARSATLERFSGQAEIPFRGLVPATLTTSGAVAGHANGITIDPRSGELAGGADPRSDGAAAGC